MSTFCVIQSILLFTVTSLLV